MTRPLFILGYLLLCCSVAQTQQTNYPREIRGYKVERTAVEVKQNGRKSNAPPNTLLRFGEAKLARVTPLGITLEIPLVISPITQKGRVHELLFQDIVVNGTPVQIDDYLRPFDLPNKRDLVLKEPLSFFVSLPNTMLAGISELADSKDTWPVTGRVYVLGRYKKFLLTFKRAVPVEIDLTIKNPLKK